MKQTRIPFSTPMAKACAEGRKTQTRRIAAVSAFNTRHEDWGVGEYKGNGLRFGTCWELSFSKPHRYNEKHGAHLARGERITAHYSGAPVTPDQASRIVADFFCPYGGVGDRLIFTERWAAHEVYDPLPPSALPVGARIWYEADGEDGPSPAGRGRWRHPMFMPVRASRFQTEITGVRLERVQDISEADARAEGMQPNWAGELSGWNPDEHGFLPFDADDEGNVPGCDPYDSFTARDCFARLWDSINGKRPGCAWADNPWVWVVEFRTPSPPSDGVRAPGVSGIYNRQSTAGSRASR